jgi:hypothetical protein
VINDPNIFTDPTNEPQPPATITPTESPAPSPSPIKPPLTENRLLSFHLFLAVGVVAFVLIIIGVITALIYLRRKKANRQVAILSDIKLSEFDSASHSLRVALGSKLPAQVLINFSDISIIEDVGRGEKKFFFHESFFDEIFQEISELSIADNGKENLLQ